MRKQIIFIIAILLEMNCYSQITFEKGYYIDNSNQKVNCFIKNKDWESNPDSFEYKLSDSAEIQTLSIKSVREFCISNKIKYKRFTVKIDRSSNKVDELDGNPNPVFNEEVLFLKVLVEGEADLYVYNSEGLTRYFFDTDHSDIEQLVHKSYITPKYQIAENNLFIQQLLVTLGCPDIPIAYFQYLKYDRRDLVNYFVKYNKWLDATYTMFDNDQHKDLFNLRVKPGLNYSSLYIARSNVYFKEIDFPSKINFRFGLEVEFIMPFNKNKWAMFSEPTYQYYKAEASTIVNASTGEGVTGYVDYKSLELPFGIRYYVFLNNESSFYINASVIYDFKFNSSYLDVIKQTGYEYISFNFLPKYNFAAGLGYRYKDRYSIEIDYHSNRDLLSNYMAWESQYKTIAIVFGYSIF